MTIDEIKKYIRDEISAMLSNNIYFKLGELNKVSLNVKKNDSIITEKGLFKVKAKKRCAMKIDIGDFFHFEDTESDNE